MAPTSVTTPSSTSGSSTSCWALLKRWISSMNSSVRCPPAASSLRASSSTSRKLLDAAGHGAELPEATARLGGQQPRKRRLAVPGGP